MEQLIALCEQRALTLVVDYCLAQMNPFGRHVPIVSRLPSSNGLSWILLGDTGKIVGLNGAKFGAVAWSEGWREPLEAAQSNWSFQYSQYDLWLLAAILSDGRFPAYLRQANRQIAANYSYLRDELAPPLAMPAMDAGCFCLVDAAGLGLDDVSYAALLRDQYQALAAGRTGIVHRPAGVLGADPVRFCLRGHPRRRARPLGDHRPA